MKAFFSKVIAGVDLQAVRLVGRRREVLVACKQAPTFRAVACVVFGFAAIALNAAPITADNASLSSSLSSGVGGGKITFEASGVEAVTPTFFSAVVDQTARVGRKEIITEARVDVRVLQGNGDTLSLGVSPGDEVVSVTGPALGAWSVREQLKDSSGRFLDLQINRKSVKNNNSAQVLSFVVRLRSRAFSTPGMSGVPLVLAGNVTRFESRVHLQADKTVDLRVQAVTAMLAIGSPQGLVQSGEYVMQEGTPSIQISTTDRGAALAPAELTAVQLTGVINEESDSVDFRLKAQARVSEAGARIQFLTGRAGVSEKASGDGWHVELVQAVLPSGGTITAYDLVFDRKGNVPVEIAFSARLQGYDDQRSVSFRMPAGAVVPVLLTGLPATGVTFDPKGNVLTATTAGWQGSLPADGSALISWKRSRETAVETLSFTSAEVAEVRVGAGLLRQTSQLTFRVLQGKLSDLRLRIEGQGEIVGVEGTNVLSWKVVPTLGDGRALEIKTNRPLEGESLVTIRSQATLNGFPVRAEPLRLTPDGSLRHAGFVRVANTGAVRLEVADIDGMMQLAPGQFPSGEVDGGARQVFVYRFPSSEYGYKVLASQILPEVGVSAIVTYELAETDRVINADLELDVREAPLRDWSLEIPEDYAVVSVQGAGVADYALESAVSDGRRTLKVQFTQAVDGRQLVKLRLEKNQAAGAGDWTLMPLVFPGAKTVRGHVGVVSAPGYRITPASVKELVEVPLSYFPRQTAGLQQAWRLRDANWAAAVKVEALGQSVQADVFHLYSLKEGIVYGSVLLNYFVIGAPASEWRVEVPAGVGNIDVTGQGVRREWRREGNQIIVTLHQPVLGAATLLVTFEQPMSARGGVISPGEVRPLGVQSERGYLQVVSPLQVKNQIKKADGGLLKLEPLELPAELRLLTGSPSLAVYQYTARPFALELAVDWYQPGETVDQVVDFAKLSSRVANDGQVVTTARFFVKTRGRKALRLELPAGVKLWEARVDGEVVSARADGGKTLVPLPAKLNANEPVDVVLQLGQAAGAQTDKVTVASPKLSAPMVISEWTLTADSGRLLVSKPGNLEQVRANLTERGFDWLSKREPSAVLGLLAMVALAAVAMRAGSARWLPVGFIAAGIAVVFAAGMALRASEVRVKNSQRVEFSATVVPADTAVVLNVDNVVAWRAMISVPGIAVGLAGSVLVVFGLLRSGRRVSFTAVPGAVLLSVGVLAQRGGAVGFFLLVAAAVLLFAVMPGVVRTWRAWTSWRARRRAESGRNAADDRNEGGDATSSVPLALLTLFVTGAALVFGAPKLNAQDSAKTRNATAAATPTAWQLGFTKTAQSLTQNWDIRDGRIFAEAEFTARGAAGESFLLLKAPAVLTQFASDGLRVAKTERDGMAYYVVTLERAGELTAKFKFETAMTDSAAGISLPTGPAALQRVTVKVDQAGWEVASLAAIKITALSGLPEGKSGATLVLDARDNPLIRLAPKRRDARTEETRFFAETANLFVPAPGVVNAYARVTVRPVQGLVRSVEMVVPEGFTVGDVGKGAAGEMGVSPVGSWRFDPVSRKLQVAIEPARGGTLNFIVELQRGTAALPYDLGLKPLHVANAAGEVGMVALAFGGDAQPESVKADGLSVVNVEDFDATLLASAGEGAGAATLQQVYRQNGDSGSVTLRVASVAPEVRVATKQVLSFGSDRLVLAAELNVSITRVGLFKLSFVRPEGLEVESLSGAALSHWTEAQEGALRIVTLHLNGRTIGEQKFALTLAGPAPAAQANWAVPRVLVREATRQTGELQLVPEKGLRLQAATRMHVSQLDPRAVGNPRPGALAFRLLQEDWALSVGIEALEPWVTVQALQDVTVREGQTLTRIGLRYKVENAAVKTLRVRLPGLIAEQARTVRATGPAVSDFAAVAGEPERWEIRFQRGIVGETEVQIEFQAQAGREQGREQVITPVFENVRQATQFVAVRGGGRLELDVADAPRGWTRIDWPAVPVELQDRGDRSVPALAFRVAEQEKPLTVMVRRHEVADALKLRVTGGELTTVFSPTGSFLTATDLTVEVVEKSTLRVRLPEGAKLFNTMVNGESVSVVREGAEYLFHVVPSSSAGRSAKVRIVYAVTTGQGGRVKLSGPGLSVPLENVSWRVVVPSGYTVDNYTGALQLRGDEFMGGFSLKDYQLSVVSRRTAEAKEASDFITEANVLLKRGDQQQAGEALSRASKAKALDQATNEDARVQLRALKTQQAVLSLNTRRQKLYLDNSGDTAKNAQLEQAANLNPFLQGRLNYDPQQTDQLLMGNTAEENSALRGIAGRIVDQQLAAEPAPGAIDVTLPEKGQVLTFTRSLQVDGGAPLELQLDVKQAKENGFGFGVVVLAGVALVGALLSRKTKRMAVVG